MNISVVIPLYNKEGSIRKTLRSVLNQTHEDMEIIVVDDGSTDLGPNIVFEMMEDDSRIRYFRQENQGVSVARNRGVEESLSDYIAFLDGDDEWMSGYLESVCDVIEQFPEAGMICTAGIVTCDGNVFFRLVNKYKNKTLKINYFHNPHVFTHTSATVVRKSIFQKTNGFPIGMKMNQDYACFFNIAMISDVVYNGRPLSIYCGNIPNQTTQRIGKTNEKVKYETMRLNYCYLIWESLNKNPSDFMRFTKYEIRAMVISAIREQNQFKIDYMLDNLSVGVLSYFSLLEKYMYRHHKRMSKVYILFTKCVWRLRGYPVLRYS